MINLNLLINKSYKVPNVFDLLIYLSTEEISGT